MVALKTTTATTQNSTTTTSEDGGGGGGGFDVGDDLYGFAFLIALNHIAFGLFYELFYTTHIRVCVCVCVCVHIQETARKKNNEITNKRERERIVLSYETKEEKKPSKLRILYS